MPEPKRTGVQLALYTLSVLLLPVFLYVTWRVESPWPRFGCILLAFGCQLVAKLLRRRQLNRFERESAAESSVPQHQVRVSAD
ncbi:Flp pilus assembly protein TadB [Actinopolyspora lacussalsi]|nr:Flp pilus assembly protein TadB [Actinopolyspora lacussalsi]